MAKKAKEVTEDNVLEWLQSFETAARVPVVLQILVEDGELSFISAVDRKHWKKLNDEADDSEAVEPDIDLSKAKKDVKTLRIAEDYIR